MALAVTVPALEPVEHATEARTTAQPVVPVASERRIESARVDPNTALHQRVISAQRASRTLARRAVMRPGVWVLQRRFAVLAAGRLGREPGWFAARRVMIPESLPVHLKSQVNDVVAGSVGRPGRRARQGARNAVARDFQRVRARQVHHAAHVAAPVHLVHAARPVRHVRQRVFRNPRVQSRSAAVRVQAGGGMNAVIAYAESQVGRAYVSGGEGGSGFDCSGLTQKAYARAGIALPHSSWGQAARARGVSRGQAKPGDLVIGPGHVGIYMGHGMMIDAGNHRTGVVYRKLYSGLRVARF